MKDIKKDAAQKAYDLAYKYEAERGSCPQCVLSALYETIEIGSPDIIQAADSLAGGTCLSAEGTCGALAGGLLAIGCVYGRPYEDFSNGKRVRRVFQCSQKLYDKFIEEYGSPLCKDVQSCLFGQSYRLNDKDEYQAFEEAGAHVDKCPTVAGNVARWTVEILDSIKRGTK